MKQKYTLKNTCLMALFCASAGLMAQGTEVFETEIAATASFTEGGKTFNVVNGPGETYTIFEFAGGGWDGTAPDNKFLDNTGGIASNGDGSAFSIVSSDASLFAVTQLYIFCATNALANHTGTLTIQGMVSGSPQFTITKTSGFSDVSTLSPNNGFTLINIATDGAGDYSDVAIDELYITSTGNLDYMAVDALTWAVPSTLSVGPDVTLQENLQLYPNPATTGVQFKNLNASTAYTIIDVLGKKVQQGIAQQHQTIGINSLNSGLYIVKLATGQSFKMIKN